MLKVIKVTHSFAMPLIGADPEVFVNRNGHFISAHIYEDLGSKANPVPTKHGFVQVDGVALEFNIKPAKSRTEFLHSLVWTIDDLKQLVNERDKGCELCFHPSVTFNPDYLKALPEEVRKLGCNADFNAYTLEENPSPNPNVNFRTGAGHVHIGWTQDQDLDDWIHFQQCATMARELDYYLGLPSLSWDFDDRRRQLYGKAGAFRPKPYGMEYRVLSNRWLVGINRMRRIYDGAVTAYCNVMQGNTLEARYGEFAADMIDKKSITWHTWHAQKPEIAKAVYAVPQNKSETADAQQ